jgi:tetratricopeptide (TPR) repeat protein
MRNFLSRMLCLVGLPLVAPFSMVQAQVKAWEGTITIPTYTWEADVNPKFWALEQTGLGAPPITSIIYPYTMQDNLSRTKVDRAYKALFVENEYLKITCLPELGGRLHSVLDKTSDQDMFYLNHVIKPSMIGMRGAWISGGVEWNAGPQGHTVTCVSPVDAWVGHNADGSAFLEVSNLEKSQRTRWTVRVTLHPGRAYLDERIRLFNPTDALSPYYFWNCTAFPNRPGTRFIFPMTLGTDHSGKTFFTWPIHEGRDLSWLKNHETWASIFARQCVFDFFGAYDLDADRGIVQAADHHQLSGKKAWTWGNWDLGLVSQKNLTDDDGPYIEVQSGPLPTQSDYGALWPHDEVAWQEWWYPVHGLGDGFEFATKDVALQTTRRDGRCELRMIATGRFPGAKCTVQCGQQQFEQCVDLTPDGPQVVSFACPPDAAAHITVTAPSGANLASFTSPLPVPVVEPPAKEALAEKPDEQLTVEELYLRGRQQDLATNRAGARQYYEKALAQDPGHAGALRGLGVLEFEAGDYMGATSKLERALARDPSDGLSWYFLGACGLKLGDESEALRCADHAARSFGAAALAHDLAGRAFMRLGEPVRADGAFSTALQHNARDTRARDHLLLAHYAQGDPHVWEEARARIVQAPTDLLPRTVLALRNDSELRRLVADVQNFVGDVDFELLETCLVFADLGLFAEATRLLDATCEPQSPKRERGALPLYQLAYWSALLGDEARAQDYLERARGAYRDYEFASDPDTIDALEYAATRAPADARAHLHLGNLYAHLGRVDEAARHWHWQQAVAIEPELSIASRNLGLYSRLIRKDLVEAAACYRRAITARPTDQTLYRDLAEILISDGRRPEAIGVLESMPTDQPRRADLTILLAQAYLDEKRFDDVIHLFEATQYFVAWEGQVTTWVIFSRAHVQRGRARFDGGDFAAALQDFDAALTYPENLGVGRSNKPEEAAAQYWRGKALDALGRTDEARACWQQGAAGSEGSAEQNDSRQLCQAALDGGERSEPQP